MKPLEGIRVVETATLFAGPMAATYLGDFGADVIKIEHPQKPDPSRTHGASKDGIGLWWKVIGRNKRTATADLSRVDGQKVLCRLVESADVLIENFRPGTLERWNLSPERLLEINPRLVLARVSGFGQVGPYKSRPAFGTLAEAMSGFAALTGEPTGPPTLPPFGLADGIASLATAFAVMVALNAREGTGRGQVVDLAIIEPIMMLLGPQVTMFDQLGVIQQRMGNRSTNNAPRNTYRTKDDRWVAVSTSSQNIASRVMRLVGREDVINEDWFATGRGRALHADELDGAVGEWIAQRDAADVLAAFEKADAAIALVYDARDIAADPQLEATKAITTVHDVDLGDLRMQNILFRLSETPGGISWTGRDTGADTDEVLGEIGLTAGEIARLREARVI